MATLKIWTDFSKRKNSTKQPTGGTSITVKLKENTSIENPVFICNNVGLANYCQFANNYYFVEDVVYVTDSIVELHCSMDSMATNKSAIASYNCYVERASMGYDLMLRDTEIVPKTSGIYSTPTESDLSDLIDTTTGRYIVRILGRNKIQGFSMSPVQAEDLLNFTNEFENTNFPDVFQGLDAIVDGAVRGVFNPDKFIVSCKWFPLYEQALDLGTNDSVWLGNWSTGLSRRTVNTPKFTINKTIALPSPIYPNDFRKFDSNWSIVKIYLPCIGTVQIDPSKYPNGIGIKYIGDLYSGGLTVLLADADSNAPIQQFNGTIGIDVPLGRAYQNTLGLASGLLNPTQMLDGVQPNISMIGGTGSIASIQEMSKIRISIYGHNASDFANTKGRPVCKNITLGSLSGFVKCAGASLDSIAYGKEKDTINNYLNSGFYME